MTTGANKSDTQTAPINGGVPDPAFPTIGDTSQGIETYVGDFRTRDEAEAGFKDLSTKVSDFEKWRAESSEREQRMQDTINRLISSAPATGQQGAPLTQKDDLSQRFDALADPVEKPEEFKRGLAETIVHAVTSAVKQTSSVQNRSQAADSLYGDFKKRHADLAKYEPIIEQATLKESRAIIQRGGDVYQAMTTDPDGFMDRVARTTRTMLTDMGIEPDATKAGEGDGGGGDLSKTVNRTGGIPGAAHVSAPGGGGGPQVSSFVNELKEMQSKNGFF